MEDRRGSGTGSKGGPITSRSRWGVVVVAVVAALALLLPRACADEDGFGRAAEVLQQPPGPVTLPELTADEEAVLGRFGEVAAMATQAVVRIESRAAARPTAEGSMLPPGFAPFFGPEGSLEPMPQVAGGSGVIVSSDGHIVTNAHVVQNGGVTVWLDDRRSFEAEVVGVDPTTDVAVLDIDAEGLPTLAFAAPEDLDVGDWVLAIGSPGVGGGQLEQTVTAGIVSAVGRPLELLSQGMLEDPQMQALAGYAIEDFIQTDAVINPGNSGGPLVDMEGRIAGINTAIASPTGYFLGYGFAVPADLVAGVMEDLIEFGEVRRAFLGINMTTVTAEDAEYFGLPEVSGVLVQDVTAGSPAAAAGLRRGDVIVSVGGAPVERSASLQRAIAQRSPGDEVELGVMRDGEQRSVSVELDRAELPAEQAPPAEEGREPASALGLALGPLTPDRRAEIGYDPSVAGALVVDVVPLSPADRKGIVPGAVIVAVDGERVESPDEAAGRLGAVEPGAVTALLMTLPGGAEFLVTLRMPS